MRHIGNYCSRRRLSGATVTRTVEAKPQTHYAPSHAGPEVPLSELEGYAAELKSVTAGRGRYSLDFSHYEPVPAQVQQKLVEAYKPRHEEE